MTQTTLRDIDGKSEQIKVRAADLDPAPPPRCPYSRHYSKVTGQYSIRLDYAGLTQLMDHVFDVWDIVEAKFFRDAEGCPEPGTLAASLVVTEGRIADEFEALIERIGALREWTGWDGVPREYTGQTP